jgi:uncharacterized Zn finger protein
MEYLSPKEIAFQVYVNMTKEDKKFILETVKTEDGMIRFHSSVGRDIRNNYGLWEKNNPWVQNQHPDDVSFDVLKKVWRLVNENE